MSVDTDTVRLFLHVLGAGVWVGGQIVLAGLVPTLRDVGDDAPTRVAHAFHRVAWPFFGLAVVTGVWMLTDIEVEDRSSGYQVALMLKLLIVATSGASAYLHSSASTRTRTALWGALGGATALAALFFGAILATNG